VISESKREHKRESKRDIIHPNDKAYRKECSYEDIHGGERSEMRYGCHKQFMIAQLNMIDKDLQITSSYCIVRGG